MLLLPLVFYGQKYTTRTGTIDFEASVPSFEEVAAKNNTVSAVLDASKGDLAVLALMKGFRFKVALMEEHFNESYAETDKFPKATFKGKIEKLNIDNLTAQGQVFTITGELTLHGKTKKITDRVVVSRSGNNITLTGKFEVKPSDFGIEVPQIVSSKIAEKVTVNYALPLVKQ